MIAIIKYNAGNTKSVQNALARLGCESLITDCEHEIQSADKVIFPGVGQARSAMEYLKTKKLDRVIKSCHQPFLGICLGLQLMCEHTEEANTDCLGIFKTNVKRFPPNDKVPHIGWNNFSTLHGDLFHGISKNQDVYYVHSYYAEICEHTVATSDYIQPFSGALQKDHFYATQFHPEKSGKIGDQILTNFLEL